MARAYTAGKEKHGNMATGRSFAFLFSVQESLNQKKRNPHIPIPKFQISLMPYGIWAVGSALALAIDQRQRHVLVSYMFFKRKIKGTPSNQKA